MSFVQSYPWGVFAPGPGSYDQIVQKPYPGLVLSGTEPSGRYYEIREINGELWFIQNATFAGNEFTPVNATIAATAFKISTASDLVFMSGGTGVSPITWTVTFTFPMSGALTVNSLDVLTSATIGTTLAVGTNATIGGELFANSGSITTSFSVGGELFANSGSITTSFNVGGELFANSAAITTTLTAQSLVATGNVDATGFGLTAGVTTNNVLRTDGTYTFITAFQSTGGFVVESTFEGTQLLFLHGTSGSLATIGGLFPNGTSSLNTPALYSGTGVPTFAAMNGSQYLREDGTYPGTTRYVNSSGPSTIGTTWSAVATG
jgi:hypothetical protein